MSDDTASEDRKYPKTYTLAQLQTALRNDEPWWGGITAIKAIGDYSVVTFKKPRLPKRRVTLLPMIGDAAPPAPDGTALAVTGEAMIQSVAMKVAVFRKN